jgi:hypothetical protein
MKTFRLFVESSDKHTKAEVEYTDHASKHNERCELCTHFRLAAPDFETAKCAVVEGVISKEGWCEEFSKG